MLHQDHNPERSADEEDALWTYPPAEPTVHDIQQECFNGIAILYHFGYAERAIVLERELHECDNHAPSLQAALRNVQDALQDIECKCIATG